MIPEIGAEVKLNLCEVRGILPASEVRSMKQFVTGMALGAAAGAAAGALGMSSLSHAQQRHLKKAAAEAARTLKESAKPLF